MLGFFVGTACLVGLVAVARAGRHRHFGFGGWHHRHRGPGGRLFLRRVLERLETTPGQERVIREAIHDLKEDAAGLRGEVRGTRHDLAQALRAPELDRGSLALVFAKHDEVLEKLRASLLDATEKVHTTLDERQRKQLADLVEAGPFGCASRG